MKTSLKATLESALENWMQEVSNNTNPPWDELIHPELITQMANAAEMVFDSAQNAQKYMDIQRING